MQINGVRAHLRDAIKGEDRGGTGRYHYYCLVGGHLLAHRPDWKRVVYAAMPSVRRLRVVRGALARSSRFAGFGKRTSHALASRDLQ